MTSWSKISITQRGRNQVYHWTQNGGFNGGFQLPDAATGDAVATRKRIEIDIQTDQVLIIRRRRATRMWCRECGCEVDMLNLNAAQTLSGLKPSALRQYIENKAWHSSKDQDGQPLLCLESLLKWWDRFRK
jgi:hypothetical protein